jgi:predicted alpha/beta hydrolase
LRDENVMTPRHLAARGPARLFNADCGQVSRTSVMSENGETELTFSAADGFRLAASHFHAETPAQALVLIASATAVPRQYYGKFARFLTERALDVLTFDYRGIGGSRPASLRGFPARMRDWALLDLKAAVDFAAERAGGKPLFFIGHSFGGQALGLLPNNEKVSRAVFVASQIGYWRLFPFPENYRIYAMLNWIGPLVAHSFGYVPGWLGLGVDLPKNVFLEWAGWCMRPDYLFDDETLNERKNFLNYRGALRGIGMSDDKWAPPIAVEKLLAHYTGTKAEHITLRPGDIGQRAVGHFGFFRETGREKLWPLAAGWFS